MAYDQSVRQLMTSSGYDPSKIGYNNSNGYVQYDGRDFMKPQKNYNGTTFTDQSTFDQAHNAFKASDPYSGSLFHPDTGGRSYEQNLGYWAQNHQAGMDEYNRANQAMSVYKALNDTAKMNDATSHIGRLQTILGINPNQSQQDTSVQNMLASIQQQLGSKTPYDVYSDPAYAAAQAQQQKQAQQAIMAGQEAMGTSGMARSSDLARYAQGQQNDASQYLMTQIVPQLMQQHSAQEQQKLQNMLSVLSPLMQEQQMNQQQKQQDWENRFNYGQSVGQFGNGQKTLQAQQADSQNAQWEQKFNEDVRQFGLQHALQQWQAQQSAANAAADNARANNSANTGLLMDIWRASGKAPAGIPGVAEGTPYSSGSSGSSGASSELDGLYAGLSSGQIDAASATDEIKQKVKLGLYTPQEASQMLALIDNFGKSSPIPAMSQPTQQQIATYGGGSDPTSMTQSQLDKLWASDPTGQAAGRPRIDWAQWYRDPNGRLGGVSYESWHKAYGPRISAKK